MFFYEDYMHKLIKNFWKECMENTKVHHNNYYLLLDLPSWKKYLLSQTNLKLMSFQIYMS